MSEPLDLPTILGEGDPAVVSALIAGGEAFRYKDEDGYTAIIHAVCGRDVARDPRLLDLLRVLVGAGVDPNGISKYHESALRILSRMGRFYSLRLLIEAGADRDQLGWNPLLEAASLGAVADIERLVRNGAPLEAMD